MKFTCAFTFVVLPVTVVYGIPPGNGADFSFDKLLQPSMIAKGATENYVADPFIWGVSTSFHNY